MTRVFKYLSWSFLAIFVAVLGYASWLCYRAQPTISGTVRLPGLQRSVEVVRDAVGVPHIFAQTFDDALFAQGYVAAQDRLWQMDVLRRLGYGELSEIFGLRALETDREQRLLGFKRLVGRQEQNLPPEELRCLQRYSEGVNAFILRHRDCLPVEFYLLRYQPVPWSPRDTLVLNLWMGKLLSTSWDIDLMREMIYKKLDRNIADQLLVEFSPDDVPIVGGDTAPRWMKMADSPFEGGVGGCPSRWPKDTPRRLTPAAPLKGGFSGLIDLPELRDLLSSSPDLPGLSGSIWKQ